MHKYIWDTMVRLFIYTLRYNAFWNPNQIDISVSVDSR